MLPAVVAVLLAAQGQGPLPAETRAADPAYASDGRLAVSVRGDLWVLAGGDSGSWMRITSGPASDRQPAWTPDGSALLFTSDRAGTFDLWRVGIGPAGATGASERITSAPEWEGEPTVGTAGDIVFVRGTGPMARLVRRSVVLFHLLRDVAEDDPAAFSKAVLEGNVGKLDTAVMRATEARYGRFHSRLRRSVLRAVLFLLFTKTLLAVLIELPYE